MAYLAAEQACAGGGTGVADEVVVGGAGGREDGEGSGVGEEEVDGGLVELGCRVGVKDAATSH